MSKQRILNILIVLLILAGAFIARFFVLGGVTHSTKLDNAAPLSGVVAQSLYTGQGKIQLPVPGVDFNLSSVQYFDNGQWVVARVVPTHNQFNQSMVVLKNINGSYEVVLGPGSAFDSSSLLSMPKDAAQYLNTQGVVYEPAS